MTATWVKDLVGTSVRPAVFGIGGNSEMRSDLVKSDEAARWWNTDTASDPPTRSKREGAVVDSIPTPEIWKPVPGFEAYYEVSDQGRVRSLARSIEIANGSIRRYRGVTIKPWMHKSKMYMSLRLAVAATKQTFKVHRLVMAAFVGPCPDGVEVCHNNGDPADNRLVNLRYDTHHENMVDIVRHGRHFHALKERCPATHPYDETNTYRDTRGRRRCRTCMNAQRRARRRRRVA